MTLALSVAVPLLVGFYFLYLSRRAPIAVAGIALIPFLGRSIFLDTYQWTFSGMGPAIGIPEVVLLGLVLATFYLRLRRPYRRGLPASGEILLAALLAAWIALEVLITITKGNGVAPTLRASALYLFPAVGVFLWGDLLMRSTREETRLFIEGLVAVAVATSPLYCAQAVGLHVYPFRAIYTYTVHGAGVLGKPSTIVRDFLTFNPFTFMAFAWLLTDWRRRSIWYLQFTIVSAAIFLTFTRSLIIPALASILLIGALALTAKGPGGERWVRATRGASGVLLGVVALAVVAPVVTSFVFGRFGRLLEYGAREPNWVARIDAITRTAGTLSGVDLLTGIGVLRLGVLTPGVYLGPAGLSIGDTMWPVLLLYTGFVGAGVVLAILVFCTVTAFAQMIRHRHESGSLYPFLAVWFIQMVIDTFISPGFVWMGVVAGLPVALLLMERKGLWRGCQPQRPPYLARSSAADARRS